MKKNHIKLIFNPNAGNPGENPSDLLQQAVTHLIELGFNVDVTLAPRKKTRAAARKAAKAGYKTVVVMGGDGTIEAAADGLIGTKARLGILPHGTYNNLAKSLGIPEDLHAACEMIKQAPKRRMDVGSVKGKNKKMHFFEEVGIGLTAAVFPEIKDVHKLDLQRVTQAVKTFVGYQTPHFVLTLDNGSHVEADTLLVSIANAPAYGVNFLEAPEASLEDGLLEIRLYPGFSKAELLEYFGAIMNGKLVNDDRVQRYRSKKITVQSDPPQEAVADNIMLGAGKVRATVERKALRIIAPSPKKAGLAQAAPPQSEQLPAPVTPDVHKDTEDTVGAKQATKNQY